MLDADALPAEETAADCFAEAARVFESAASTIGVIERRYLAGSGTTLKELGRAFGISRERVRQLEARAKAKMREELADVWDNAA